MRCLFSQATVWRAALAIPTMTNRGALAGAAGPPGDQPCDGIPGAGVVFALPHRRDHACRHRLRADHNLYLSAAWLSIIGLIILGEVVVTSEHLRRSSLDSQLVRLGVRLVGVLCVVGFLIRGADELGFPAYSVLAGLGVGGPAVSARSARRASRIFLGSLLIMFESPFASATISGSAGRKAPSRTSAFAARASAHWTTRCYRSRTTRS